MTSLGFSHVSVSATRLDESVAFYREFLGMEPVPTPNFGFPVQWLQVGDVQLHLFEREVDAPTYHHVAITVDDLEAVYWKAVELGILDVQNVGHYLVELPDKCLQLFVRDPAGNLLEIDWRGTRTLDARITQHIRRLVDVIPQSDENMRAQLYRHPIT